MQVYFARNDCLCDVGHVYPFTGGLLDVTMARRWTMRLTSIEMTAEKHEREPTERTPKGLEVPIPQRREFFDNLKKVAKPQVLPRPPAQSGMRGKGGRRPPPPHSSGRHK
jgi:hypothetical protein